MKQQTTQGRFFTVITVEAHVSPQAADAWLSEIRIVWAASRQRTKEGLRPLRGGWWKRRLLRAFWVSTQKSGNGAWGTTVTLWIPNILYKGLYAQKMPYYLQGIVIS